MKTIDCFKAYDIRGRVPDQLNEQVAFRIGVATARFLKTARVVVGHDIRHSSVDLLEALCGGFRHEGVEAFNIGLCGTEHVYFATSHLEMDAGIMVTASHNPADYNGLKIVRAQSRPVSEDTGLKDIRSLAEHFELPDDAGPALRATPQSIDISKAYIEHLMSYIDPQQMRPLKIVSNPGNGGAGLVIDRLEPLLPFGLVKVHHDPDPDFPNGIPNPLLPENRAATRDAVVAAGADMGIAWDGDFDRCFFFDETGEFIEGYYIVGLLAQSFLEREPGAAIVHDPRLTWNTIEIVRQHGGRAVQCKSGHAFMKDAMRAVDAVYGGEMSAHHYFRDFAYCDSGMIPWLLVAQIISQSGKPLSQLVNERVQAYPSSGEINRKIPDAASVLRAVEARYAAMSRKTEHVDGLSMEFDDWRFNLRSSNTEPLVRLNVESRGDRALMDRKTRELLALMTPGA